MPSLHYCSTHYDAEAPIDINPLLTLLYRGKKLLAIVAREGMRLRIEKMTLQDGYSGPSIDVYGVWDLAFGACLKLEEYDAVVIVGRDRVHSTLEKYIQKIEDALS